MGVVQQDTKDKDGKESFRRKFGHENGLLNLLLSLWRESGCKKVLNPQR
jgi:hypothetical protein